MLISIVIPVLNEEESISRLIGEIEKIRRVLHSMDLKTEVVITDNFSSDNSWKLIKNWSRESSGVKGYRLARNYGFQASLMNGMQKSNGDAVVIFQADLQDPPELIVKFVEEWLQGARVVAGVITKRGESGFSSKVRKLFYVALSNSSDSIIEKSFQDFYLLDKSVYKAICIGPNVHQFLRGKISSEFGIDKKIPYSRNSRELGKTKFNFSSKYSLALDGILMYSDKLFRRIQILSGFLFLFSIFALLVLLISYIFGIRFAASGWLSLFIFQLLLVSLVSAGFGLVFEYLIRILKLNANNNQTLIINETD